MRITNCSISKTTGKKRHNFDWVIYTTETLLLTVWNVTVNANNSNYTSCSKNFGRYLSGDIVIKESCFLSGKRQSFSKISYSLFYNFVASRMLFITVPVRCSVSCRCRKGSQQNTNVFDCSNTEITSLSDIFVPKDTNWLVAKDNKINRVEWFNESSRNLYQIEHINLANSSIKSIEPNFFSKLSNLTKLRYLNLADNKLKGFNEDIQKSWIREMHLSGNPIDCNCTMFWFAEWLNKTVFQNKNVTGPRIVRDYKDIRCVGGEWNEVQVYKLNKEQMGCLPTRSIREL